MGDAVSPDELAQVFSGIAELGALVTLHCEEVLSGDDTSLAAHAALRPEEGGETTCMEMVAAQFLRVCLLISAISPPLSVRRRP
ncbi:hypothetical protein [Methanogenium cariaci]|uniref:hypothetical protein n=1 Tax=Methanogenium cariaci TaxID=2197 RepID=UPI000785CE17|nr:hypothetical protein [Methanogenium cariaci]